MNATRIDKATAVVRQWQEALGGVLAEPDSDEAMQVLTGCFSNDLDWNIAGDHEHVPWLGPRGTAEEVADFYRTTHNLLRPVDVAIGDVVTDGRRVFVPAHVTFFVQTTEKTIDTDMIFDLTISDGLISRYRVFEDSFAVSSAMRD